ncbi:MAG: type II toxin-antitoxin system VapC family toxin [Burkholderiaceae bacterium]|jgi:predicted nucleic acid-binding protein|nr:type II toxin-antitoxin system VapC family toxin [Burkholderiaceae bacterium]
MNVVDSCGWLEYFSDGPNAGFFAPAIENTAKLLVPTLTLFEVFKRILQQRTEADALRAIALIRQGQLIDLSDAVTLGAARLSFDLKLPLADSIILFSARMHDAKLWTQDAHFEGISGVSFVRKTGSGSST